MYENIWNEYLQNQACDGSVLYNNIRKRNPKSCTTADIFLHLIKNNRAITITISAKNFANRVHNVISQITVNRFYG